MSSLGFDRLIVNCRQAEVGAHQELDLTTKYAGTDTGLTGGNAYQIKVNAVNYTITMPAGTVTYLAMIKAINSNADIIAARIRAVLVGGDVRFYIFAATIALTAGTADDLLAALTSTPAAAVQGIMLIEFPITGKRAIINALSVNFPAVYNDDLVWDLIRYVGDEYNQRFSAAVSSSTTYHKEDLLTPCGYGDKILVSTEITITALTGYVTLSWSHNGF